MVLIYLNNLNPTPGHPDMVNRGPFFRVGVELIEQSKRNNKNHDLMDNQMKNR